MGGRGSNSKLGYSGKGGVGGVPGGGAGGSGVDGSGHAGGTSAGGNPNHLEAGPGGQTLNKGDQRGGQETNGMAGNGNKELTPRDHLDEMTEEEGITQIMLDTGMSRADAEAAYDAIRDYTDDSNAYHTSDDPVNYGYGDRPLETDAASAALDRMPPYEGEIFNGRSIPVQEFDDWLDTMHKGDQFGFMGTYTGDEFAHSFDTWSSEFRNNVGTITSFSSNIDVASGFSAYCDFNLDGTVESSSPSFQNVNKYSVLFRCVDNKHAPSITHLSSCGYEEYEVMSSKNQVFIFDHVDKGVTATGQPWAIVWMRDGGLKTKGTKYRE